MSIVRHTCELFEIFLNDTTPIYCGFLKLNLEDMNELLVILSKTASASHRVL